MVWRRAALALFGEAVLLAALVVLREVVWFPLWVLAAAGWGVGLAATLWFSVGLRRERQRAKPPQYSSAEIAAQPKISAD
jgi:hypothetical protein